MNIRFGICADVHTEYIHDSVSRIKTFIDKCKQSDVDFCIQLGDFCPPGELNINDKKQILGILDSFGIPFYHVLGNHDMDNNSKKSVTDFLGIDYCHTSFDMGHTHFIVLDACYYESNGNYFSYDNGNYKNANIEKVSVIPPNELKWLENDLADAKYPAVIFSHQSLVESRSGICNAENFRDVVKSAPNGVLLAVCGHEHVDRLEKKDGVWYYCLNSMSYYWAGNKYRHITYEKSIVEKYPMLTKVFPYRDPLFSIIEIDDNGISILGTKSEIVGQTPEKIGFIKAGLKDQITASIQNRKI